MQIGKAGPAITSICEAHADRIEVRGRDLTRDLMGRIGFTDYFHLLLTGREPTENQRFFLDLLLVAIAEHGLVPTVQAAREKKVKTITLAGLIALGLVFALAASGVVAMNPQVIGQYMTVVLVGVAVLFFAGVFVTGGENQLSSPGATRTPMRWSLAKRQSCG